MLPRPRSGLFVSCSFALALVGWLLLSACRDNTQASAPTSPATEQPSGVLDLKASTKVQGQLDQALAELASQTTLPGLKFHALEHKSKVVAALLEIDLQRFQPKVIAAPAAKSRSKGGPKSAGISPATAIAEPGMTVIVGSSFVSQVRLMQPIGVLQTEGKLLQSVEPHGYTRILGIQKGPSGDRFGVAHRSQWPVERFHSALQAGPGILEKGLLDISERDLERQKYFRSFVAACGERSVVGITLVPMHLYTLGSELVQLFADRGLLCNDVVNLAGDRESVLLVRDADKAIYFGDPFPTKAGLIGFRQNDPAAVLKKPN